MKTLQNIGWFVLAFLSFLMVYSFIQGVALLGLGAGVPIYGILPLYILLAGVYCFFVYKWYKMSPVTIGTTGFNRYIWLPALVWFLVIVAQFFLPEEPSANQQIITELALEQPILVYASLGFSLGLAYISKGGLAYSIALHALNNLIAFLMIVML